MTPRETIDEPARSIPVLGDYEVVVLGGGPAGIAAAATAAGLGRRTLMVERYGFLGGMGTAAGVTNFCGLHANVHGEIRRVVRGVADDLLSRIDHLGGLRPPHSIFGKTLAQAYDTAAYKIAADDLLTSRGAHLLFHAYAAAAIMDGARIKALVVETKSGRQAIVSQTFIDCSGDGDLALYAGARFDVGDADGHLLFPSTMFRVNNVAPAAADGEHPRDRHADDGGRAPLQRAVSTTRRDRAAAEEPDRMARQRHAGAQRPRPRGRRHGCRTTLGR